MLLEDETDEILLQTGVYSIRNTVDGRQYIGSAATTFKRRKRRHLNSLRKGRGNYRLRAAWDERGEAAFEFLVLEVCEPERCLEREQYWMDVIRSVEPEFGYNCCPAAGSLVGAKLSEQHKQSIAESVAEAWRQEGYREAVAAKISATLKERWEDQDFWEKMIAARRKSYSGNYDLRARVSDNSIEQWENYTDEQRAEALRKMAEGSRKVRGEDRYNSVLTEEIVLEARLLRAQGWTYRSLQERYGCGFITIYKAVVGTTWSHI